jgi:hypothetical protein
MIEFERYSFLFRLNVLRIGLDRLWDESDPAGE